MPNGGYLDAALSAITDEESRSCCVITDPRRPDNPIVYVTPEFEMQTGYTAAEAVGRNCRFLQGADTDAATVQEIRSALAEGKPVKVDILNYRKDGTPFWNRLSIRPLFDEKGVLRSFVGAQRIAISRKALDREFGDDLSDT